MTLMEDNTTEQEFDWEFPDFAWKVEEVWQEELRKSLPTTTMGWLEIFPEGKVMIPAKIKEWKQRAEAARLLVKEALRVIETRSAEENRWFWLEVLKNTFQPFEELMEARRHIKRLKWAVPSKKKSKVSIRESVIERARNADMIGVAEMYGLKLKKSGQRYYALCPRHIEHTPSFCIYPPARYHCFGCQIDGDQIAFVQMMDGCSFVDAVRKLQTM